MNISSSVSSSERASPVPRSARHWTWLCQNSAMIAKPIANDGIAATALSSVVESAAGPLAPTTISVTANAKAASVKLSTRLIVSGVTAVDQRQVVGGHRLDAGERKPLRRGGIAHLLDLAQSELGVLGLEP